MLYLNLHFTPTNCRTAVALVNLNLQSVLISNFLQAVGVPWRPDALVRSSDSQILLAQLVLIGVGRSGTGTKSNTGILAANFHLIEQGSDEPSKYAFNIFEALNFW